MKKDPTGAFELALDFTFRCAGRIEWSMKLGIQEIYEAARAAGFTPDQATTWTAIALAESGGETGALNDTGEHSMGLWQINVSSSVRENVWGNLNDPVVNARAAYDISNHGLDMRPWTTTHASHEGTAADYRTYLDDVSAITGYAGDNRGVEGYGSPLPDPLEPSAPTTMSPASIGYDQIDLGMEPDANLDTDQDGLTDTFERLSGSSPNVADTDQDGLSDSYETVVSKTSTTLADSDLDQASDSTEVLLGTSPTTWDTDGDGFSDSVEAEFGTDPLVAEPGTESRTPTETVSTTTTMSSTMASSSLGGVASTASQTTGTDAANGTKVDVFVQSALAQKGDTYVYGAEADLDDSNPDTFDCSELTQWAADQAGVTIPDGAMYQYLDLKSQGELMSVDEALHTKGALLFYFSSEPTADGGRPSEAHVAISLGDGRTIEARGSSYGVNEFPAEGRFNYAGMIPEMAGAADPTAGSMPLASYDEIDAGAPPDGSLDSDADGLSDEFEKLSGLNPLNADSDGDGGSDSFELLQAHTDPMAVDAAVRAAVLAGLDPGADEDSDGLSNDYEAAHSLDPRAADTDLDGLSDSTELALGTNATLVDTDADGLTDNMEVEFGSDPLVAGSAADGWGVDTDLTTMDPDALLDPNADTDTVVDTG
jgi:cell wall-associated NlpC family hydrolase